MDWVEEGEARGWVLDWEWEEETGRMREEAVEEAEKALGRDDAVLLLLLAGASSSSMSRLINMPRRTCGGEG